MQAMNVMLYPLSVIGDIGRINWQNMPSISYNKIEGRNNDFVLVKF